MELLPLSLGQVPAQLDHGCYADRAGFIQTGPKDVGTAASSAFVPETPLERSFSSTPDRSAIGGFSGSKVHTRHMISSPITLSEHFADLASAGRGDSARGRSLHALYFLEHVWKWSSLPLSNYRPSRRPAAFLAMVFDLVGDASHGYTDLLLEGRRSAVQRSIGARLEAPWLTFLGEVSRAGFPCLASVLNETLSVALRNPAHSDLNAHLSLLRRYLTPQQRELFDLGRFIGTLKVAEVFGFLRFCPVTTYVYGENQDDNQQGYKRHGYKQHGEEQHPVGGDLRRAIRASYDEVWCGALDGFLDSAAQNRTVRDGTAQPDFVALLACLPVDALRLLRSQGAQSQHQHAQDPYLQDLCTQDFAVFYACITDAHAPGRVWEPLAAYIGGGDEDRRHFSFLSARGRSAGLSRKTQGLARIGLSSTFPKTVRRLDGWLRKAERFSELHAQTSWCAVVLAHADAIAQARANFLGRLAQRLKAG